MLTPLHHAQFKKIFTYKGLKCVIGIICFRIKFPVHTQILLHLLITI